MRSIFAIASLILISVALIAGCSFMDGCIGPAINGRIFYSYTPTKIVNGVCRRGEDCYLYVYKNNMSRRILHAEGDPCAVSFNGKKFITAKGNIFRIYNLYDKENTFHDFQTDLKSVYKACWFPNSDSKFLYVGNETLGAVNGHYVKNIYEFDIKTEASKKITSFTTPIGSVWDMAISPDGKNMVYSYSSGDKMTSESKIMKIMNLETKQEEVLPFCSTCIAWSPKGDVLAFMGFYDYKIERSGEEEKLIIYNVETKKFQKYVPEININVPNTIAGDSLKQGLYVLMRQIAEYPQDLFFSPDGKRLTYTRFRLGSVMTMNIDGTDIKEIVKGNKNGFTQCLGWRE